MKEMIGLGVGVVAALAILGYMNKEKIAEMKDSASATLDKSVLFGLPGMIVGGGKIIKSWGNDDRWFS